MLGAPTAAISDGSILVTWQNETRGETQGRFFGDPRIGLNYTSDSGISFSDGGLSTITSDLTRTLVPADFGGEITIMGTDNVDRPMDGTNGNDTLRGLAEDDLLRGWEGDDVLDGGAGRDAIDGGIGRDTASYAFAPARVDARLNDGEGFSGEAAGDRFTSIENLTGSDFDDLLIGSTGANTLNGGIGNDTLSALAGNDTLDGGENNDTLNGGAGGDTLIGGSGIDTASYSISAAGVDVRLAGGRGFAGEAIGDTLTGIENLIGGNFNDVLVGDDGVNILTGRGGNDVLSALSGNDTLNGDGGDDTLFGGIGSDTLNGGVGIDTASYSSASAGVDARLVNGTGFVGEAIGDIYSSIENLVGSNFSDTLFGNGVVNVLRKSVV